MFFPCSPLPGVVDFGRKEVIKLDINTLDKKLDKIVMDFASEIQLNYHDGDQTPAAKEDISELARQTFYALGEFRKEIIAYLKTAR